jgi:phage terminase Nu1 subunit (DNA packaging protein)
MSDFSLGGDATQYVTKRELSEYWRCSERTIDRLLETEGLPVIRLSKRRIIFQLASVQRWLEGRTSGTTEPTAGRKREKSEKNTRSAIVAQRS